MKTSSFHSNHMTVDWYAQAADSIPVPADKAPLRARAGIVGRIGLMLLSCGTGAWRVRRAMNTAARSLGVTCTADIGLTNLTCTCFWRGESLTQTLGLKEAGVNTAKLNALEDFTEHFPEEAGDMSCGEIHRRLDAIERDNAPSYTSLEQAAAAAAACGAFTFLLGGGPVEIFCAFLGAGAGNWLRSRLLRRGYTMFLCIVLSVALSCLVYTVSFDLPISTKIN